MAELNSIEQAEGILNPIEQLDADFDFDVYTKQEVDALLDEKADADAVYTKTETDNLLNGKADADSVYTKTETNTLLSAKADKSTTLAGYGITDAYTKTETDNLLNSKADADSVYTKQEIDTKIPSSVGSATKPTYVNGGVLTECTYELNKTVPANAVFTDTTYTAGNGLNLSSSTFSAKAGTNVIVDSGGINVNGTGAVASADSGLLNGGTAFAELRPTLDGTWVKNAQTTATNLQKLEGGIEYLYGLLSHQYDQLKKYINGNYYDYQTDTDSAYTKTVPSGAMPYASLEQIGGRTLAWNQLVDSGTTTVATISGHKYYTLINGTASIVNGGSAVTIVDDTADMVTDLTLCYGSGNEPTLAEFTSQFLAQYYPYNAGTLLSAGVTSVVSKGKNLADYSGGQGVPSNTAYSSVNRIFPKGKYVVGITYTNIYASANISSYSISDNDVTVNPRSGGFGIGFSLECVAGEKYTISTDITAFSNMYGISFYGDGGAFISGSGYSTSSATVTAPAGAKVVMFILRPPAGASTTYKNVQIEHSATASTYSAPFTISTPIPASIQALEGYGWSAGTVFNYIDFERKVFVQNVGKVVLDGTQTISVTNWRAKTNSVGWLYPYNLTNNKISPTQYDVSNVVTEKIETVSYYGIYNNDVSSIATSNSASYGLCLRIADTSLTTASAINTYLSANPITVYYELATPVEVDISAYLTDDNLISVESGGTLTFPNSNGDDYRIEVPSSETFMVDLQEAL